MNVKTIGGTPIDAAWAALVGDTHDTPHPARGAPTRDRVAAQCGDDEALRHSLVQRVATGALTREQALLRWANRPRLPRTGQAPAPTPPGRHRTARLHDALTAAFQATLDDMEAALPSEEVTRRWQRFAEQAVAIQLRYEAQASNEEMGNGSTGKRSDPDAIGL